MMYQCGKSIYGQSNYLPELSVAIDAPVKAPGHGKWWLDGKTGFASSACVALSPRRQMTVLNTCNQQS